MNEASITSRLRQDILKAFPGVWWQKFADRSTLGIPDASVTFRGLTSWIEVKYKRPADDDVLVLIRKNKVQLSTMYKASVTSHDRAFYAVYCEGKAGHRWVEIWVPTLGMRLKDRDPLTITARCIEKTIPIPSAFTHTLVIDRLRRQHQEKTV